MRTSRGAELLGSLGGLGGGPFGGLLAALGPVVLALELLAPAGGIDVLHLAGEEGMAGGADFHRDLLACAARGELVAAAADDGGLGVFGMNAGFHDGSPLALIAKI